MESGSSRGGKANQFSNPVDLSLDENGILYIVDAGNHRIGKFPMLDFDL